MDSPVLDRTDLRSVDIALRYDAAPLPWLDVCAGNGNRERPADGARLSPKYLAQDRSSRSNSIEAWRHGGPHMGAVGAKRPATKIQLRRMIMKTIVSALVAMAVLAGIAGPAGADDSDGWSPDHFWQQQQNNLP